MDCRLNAQNADCKDDRSLQQLRQQYFDDLMAYASQPSEGVWLAQIISSWQVGMGGLPDFLGLSANAFHKLLTKFFPGCYVSEIAVSAIKPDFSRMLEKQDLENFLKRFALEQNEQTEWLISLIVTACLGKDHLWQDLGLWSRSDLSTLLNRYFPDLSLLNSRDMKWKKFLYKQLCETEGIYVCRAPSCDVCKDYAHCFGSEEGG